MSEARTITDDTWALMRAQFGHGETARSITPWGSGRAVIVTDFAVYLVASDEEIGFTAQTMFSR